VRSSIVRLLRIASTFICLIVLASFVIFAADQTRSASGRQQEQLAPPAAAATASAGAAATAAPPPGTHESALHRAIDDASSGLTSPFSGLVAGSESEWASHAVRLLGALLLYGFGLGYLARTLRVR
jgi:hypothetical protein